MLMIYEINHIWTAEIKWKWRNDRRSERNLCNWVKKPEKKNSGLQRDFREVTGSNPVEVLNYFSGFFTQLHKLRSLGLSFLHFRFAVTLFDFRDPCSSVPLFFFPTCLYNNLSINEDLVKQLLLHVLIIDCWQTIEGYQTSFHNTRCGWIKASWPHKTRVFNVKTRAFRLTDTNFKKMCLSQQFCTLKNIHAIHFCSHCRFMLFINHMLLKNQWIIE